MIRDERRWQEAYQTALSVVGKTQTGQGGDRGATIRSDDEGGPVVGITAILVLDAAVDRVWPRRVEHPTPGRVPFALSSRRRHSTILGDAIHCPGTFLGVYP